MYCFKYMTKPTNPNLWRSTTICEWIPRADAFVTHRLVEHSRLTASCQMPAVSQWPEIAVLHLIVVADTLEYTHVYRYSAFIESSRCKCNRGENTYFWNRLCTLGGQFEPLFWWSWTINLSQIVLEVESAWIPNVWFW
jgi:hypothetical protein